jgi:galactokinase
VVDVLRGEGLPLPGVDLLARGDVPLGAGLSSSAALEVATARALLALAGVELSGAQVARLCQRAENEFVGMPCGIMDQFVSALAERDRALLIDCRTLEFQAVPLELGEHRVVIVDSGVKHSLADSAYAERRAQCEAAAAAARRRFPAVRALRDVDDGMLAALAGDLEPLVARRARHVVGENRRTVEGVAALARGDRAAFGRAMDASHDSLRDDYEVSCPELDRLVALARAVPGVLGARMTGGGFGGCTVNLVRADAVAAFPEAVAGPYARETGRAPRVFVGTPAEGAVVER